MFSLCPHSPDFINTLEVLLKLIGGIGATYIFFLGFQRYKKDQNWKRSEFVAKEIKDFSSDPMVRNTMYMLDFSSRNIELFPDNPTYSERFVWVNRELLKNALIFHGDKPKEGEKDRFTRDEIAIRDHFDHFLSYFERFEQFLVLDLIKPEEIKPYLNYWIISICDELRLDNRKILFVFIDKYGYQGTQNLFLRFNKNIKR